MRVAICSAIAKLEYHMSAISAADSPNKYA